MPKKPALPRLVALMQKLRAPGGCPWDRKQTHESLRPFLLEETHEVLEAIDSRDPERLKDELGDLLFQVVFHAQLAAEKEKFTLEDVILASLEKMTRRHPHIFGKQKLRTSREVLSNWEEIKRQEQKGSAHSLLAGVPRTLPALLRAHRVQSKAARVGFAWAHRAQALAKVTEEIGELEKALLSRRSREIVEELGDSLFALVNLARFAGANPEDALHRAVAKFIERFSKVEEQAKRRGKGLAECPEEELLRLWQQAKIRKVRRPAKAARPRNGKSPRPR